MLSIFYSARSALLQQWKRNEGESATYKALMEACLKSGFTNGADMIIRLLQGSKILLFIARQLLCSKVMVFEIFAGDNTPPQQQESTNPPDFILDPDACK